MTRSALSAQVWYPQSTLTGSQLHVRHPLCSHKGVMRGHMQKHKCG